MCQGGQAPGCLSAKSKFTTMCAASPMGLQFSLLQNECKTQRISFWIPLNSYRPRFGTLLLLSTDKAVLRKEAYWLIHTRVSMTDM